MEYLNTYKRSSSLRVVDDGACILGTRGNELLSTVIRTTTLILEEVYDKTTEIDDFLFINKPVHNALFEYVKKAAQLGEGNFGSTVKVCDPDNHREFVIKRILYNYDPRDVCRIGDNGLILFGCGTAYDAAKTYLSKDDIMCSTSVYTEFLIGFQAGTLSAYSPCFTQIYGLACSPIEYEHYNRSGLLIMEPAGSITVEDMEILTDNEMLIIIAFIMHALMVGQEDLKLNHNDLHLRNVLLRETSRVNYHEIWVGERPMYLPGMGYVPTIIDYGFAAIYTEPKITNEEVIRTANRMDCFIPDFYNTMYDIVHFLGNLAFIRHSQAAIRILSDLKLTENMWDPMSYRPVFFQQGRSTGLLERTDITPQKILNMPIFNSFYEPPDSGDTVQRYKKLII